MTSTSDFLGKSSVHLDTVAGPDCQDISAAVVDRYAAGRSPDRQVPFLTDQEVRGLGQQDSLKATESDRIVPRVTLADRSLQASYGHCWDLSAHAGQASCGRTHQAVAGHACQAAVVHDELLEADPG